jgi:CRP-like cAMP-binding protein
VSTGTLGKEYAGGEIIFRQGDEGDCMYVIQEGEVEVLSETDGKLVRLAVLDRGDFFGEMSIFQHEHRSATVRALSDTRVLTVDKKTFLSRIQADPSLAFRIVETLTRRINQMNEELVSLKD